MESLFNFIFLLAVCWETAFIWYNWTPLAFFKPTPPVEKENSVSVVVAARNEEKRLEKLVMALMGQNHQRYEVVIVNDRSEDGSRALLDSLAEEFSQLRVIHIDALPDGWTGKKHAVYQGIQNARKTFILLTDADCIPQSPEWINQMTQGFDSRTEFILGFSPYQKKPGLLNQFIQFETLLTGVQYISAALRKKPYMGVGRNLAYRKKLFLEQGFGGDEVFVGGDDDVFVNKFANRSNTKVVISAESQVFSEPKESWREYFIQKIRHLSAGKRYRIKDQTRLGSFALANLVGWLLFLYAILSNQMEAWILILFICRSLSFYSIFTLSGQKLNVKLAFWALPLFDLCYTISYTVVGLVALTAKRIKWS